MQKKKILITGGVGFLGSNLVQDFLSSGYEVTATWNKTAPPALACHWIQIDLLNHQAIKDLLLWNRFDYIIHCAALSKTDLCEADRKYAYQMNVQTTRMLAEESLTHHTKFIFISTDLVFDGSKGWYTEDDPVNPQSYYAETKCFAEQDVRLTCSDYLIIRTALMYGNQDNGLGGFLLWTIDKMKNDEPLKLFINQFRTIVFVHDVSKSIIGLIQSSVANQTYHVAGPERLNRVEIGKRVADIFHFPHAFIMPTRIHRPIKLGELDDIALRTDKIRSAIGITFTPVNEGLAKTYEH